MAEAIRIRVKCHACGGVIEGSARYGKGHFVQEGVPFELTATGKAATGKGRQVRAEVVCICPHCTVRNKYQI